MTRRLAVNVVAVALLTACGGNKPGGPGASTGGAPADTGGTGGAAPSSTGGSIATGGTSTGGSNVPDAALADASSGVTSDGASPPSPDALGGTDATGPVTFCGGTVYSAGDVCGASVPAGKPCTILTGRAHAGGACASCPTCPPDGQQCCPAAPGGMGATVGNLLLGGGNSVTFTNVYAPADGDYNIVWYYHCGNADTDGYSSATCGSGKETAMTGNPGCREAAFTVNGVDDPKLYEMPCFLRISPADHGWGYIHSWVRTENVKSTVLIPFHLKTGNNTIKLYARSHDAVDLSAIRVPDGK